MNNGVASESGTRHRTRQAILSAAGTTLSRNRAATLADIAEAAGIGRSTLHRYFADRDELIKDVVTYSLEAIADAVEDAALHQGAPLEAMRRLVSALVDCGDQLQFLFTDPNLLEGLDSALDGDPTDVAITNLIVRGQKDGIFDAEVSPAWIQGTLWSLIYTGYEMANDGRLPRHGITSTVIRTLENGIRTPAKD